MLTPSAQTDSFQPRGVAARSRKVPPTAVTPGTTAGYWGPAAYPPSPDEATIGTPGCVKCGSWTPMLNVSLVPKLFETTFAPSATAVSSAVSMPASVFGASTSRILQRGHA